MIIYGSVCSGIESASIAWEPLGMKPLWFSEIEPFPCALLAHRFPNVPNLGDMTHIPDLIRLGLIDAPDVLVGGTPCQAFSVAGTRNSLDDERGQLTLTYVDILNAIDEVRGDGNEAICVWENVPGVLNTKDNAFGCFLGALVGEDGELQPAGKRWTNAGCVFGPKRAVAWRILDAQYFGVAQRRRRVFVVASARTGFDPAEVLFEFEGMRRDTAPSREAGESTSHDVAPSLTASGRGVERCGDTRGQDPVVAVPAEGCFWDGGQVTQTLDAVLHKGQTMPEKNRFPAVLQPVCIHGTQDPDLSDNRAHTHGRNSGQPIVTAFSCKYYGADAAQEMAVRRLTPVECERLQGFPDDWTLVPVRGKPAADGPRYKAIGNSKAVPVVRWIGRRLMSQLVPSIDFM